MTERSSVRRARALGPWMSPEKLDGLRGGAGDEARDRRARETLQSRPAGVDQTGLIAPWPAELERYGSAIRDSEAAKPMLGRGWELALVTDLRRVVAVQPTVFVEEGGEALPEPGGEALPEPGGEALPEPGDLESIARVTLPVSPPPAHLNADFDEDAQEWCVRSPNPNLRITGNFGGEVEPSVLGIGFLLKVLVSYVSVARVRGRFVLRDGYHRTYQLIAAGIHAAPVFVRDFSEDEPLFRSGMLPEHVYCGPRPPTLQDFHDDDVAEDVLLSPAETTVRIGASPPWLAFGRIN